MKSRALAVLCLLGLSFLAPAQDSGTSALDDTSTGTAAQGLLGGKPADLHFRWASGGKIVGRPLVGQGIVYFLSEDNALYGIDDSPRVLFRSGGFGPRARYAPARGGAMLVTDGDRLIRLNRAGFPAWEADLAGAGGQAGLCVPAEGRDGRIFAAGAILLCRSATGRLLWQRELSAPACAGPLIDTEGDLILCLEDGSVETWSAFGKRLWRLKGGGPPRELLISRGRILILGQDGSAREALPPDMSGTASWGPPLSLDCVSAAASPEEAPAAWYLLSGTGRLEALDQAGKRMWSIEGGTGLTRVEAFPGRVYLSGKGRVLSVTRLGMALRELRVLNASGEAAVSPTGIVYSGGLDWILYAYRFDVERAPVYGQAPSPETGGYGLMDGSLSLDQWGGPSRATISDLLDDVEKSLKSGNMDGEAESLRISAAVAQSRSRAPAGPEGDRLAAPVDLRARACAILGASGSLEARDLLLNILSGDPDPSVKAAAVEALGMVAWDADGRSVEAIGRALGYWADPSKEAMALSAVTALRGIALYEGIPPGPEGMRALIRIAEGSWPGRVRTQAEEALKAIVRTSRPAPEFIR